MPQSQLSYEIDGRDGWVLLTPNDVDVITFQVLSGEVEIRTGTTVRPDAEMRGYLYQRGEGELQVTLLGFSSAGHRRVWGNANGRGATVVVDHA